MIALAALGALLALTVYAAWRDIHSMLIPNRISAALVAGFPVVALLLGLSPEAMAGHLIAGGVAFAVCLALFYAGVVGGGDAKLFPAVALWLGAPAAGAFTLGTLVAGGVVAVLLLAARRLAPTTPATPAPLRRICDPGEGVPYGLAIAAGTMLAAPHAGWISSAFSH